MQIDFERIKERISVIEKFLKEPGVVSLWERNNLELELRILKTITKE